jgi:PAS domain S-box-containing protein
MCVQQAETGLVVLNAGSDLQKTIDTIKQIHAVDRNVYVIVSLPERFQETTDLLMKAGAHDYVLKDRNYVPNIVGAVKRALIRIAEREAFDVPVLARAQQLAMDENLPDIILSLDLDSLILHSNHAISTLLGYPQKEIVGVCFTSLIAEEAGREKFNAFLEAVDQHISFREMLLLKNHKGQPIPFDLNFTLMEGEIIYGVARKQVDQAVGWSENPDERIEPLPRQDPPDKQFPEHMPSRIGAYRIITLLGAGAMGRVYKAFDDQ